MSVVFDLDGTLIHSAPDIHAACAKMLEAEGQAPLPLDTIVSFIGNGVPKLVERVIAATGMEAGAHGRLVADFLAHYDRDPATLTRPYPGVRAALAELRRTGQRLGICTNKPEAPTRTILGLLDMAADFESVVGGDSYPEKKPDPTGLLACFEALGPGPRLYVGDSETDAETAERAGVPFLLFTEGYRKRSVEELTHAEAFDRFERLPDMVARHLAHA